MRAALISLVVGLVILVVKFRAYQMTGSTAVLSDALESIVNVFAAAIAVAATWFAAKPADRNHPFGHGKIEFVSAAFEGGLIAFAAFLIVYESVGVLFRGAELQSLDSGLLIVIAAGIANAILGLFLIRTGRKYDSIALVADGQHTLSDFWTSLGVGAGLGLVLLTGIVWLDPIVAILVALRLAYTGVKLVREALAGLMDEEDPEVVEALVEALESSIVEGIVRVHSVRVIRAGRFHHVNAHLVLPMFWDVATAHNAADDYEKRILAKMGIEGEIEFHTDPCWQIYCAACEVRDCPVRVEPFESRPPMTIEEAVLKDLPPDPDEAKEIWNQIRNE